MRFAGADACLSSLRAGKLRLAAISQKDFDDQSWLPAVAKLRGKGLLAERFQLLDALISRSPPLRHLALLLASLLTRWCKEEILEDEHEVLKQVNSQGYKDPELKMRYTKELEQRKPSVLLHSEIHSRP